MALNPAVFSIRLYGLHAVALLALNLVAVFVFVEHMFGARLKLPARFRFFLYLILSLIQLLFLPDIVEGIYWFNGAWFYMGAQAVALITLVLCDRLAVSAATRFHRAVMAIFCAGLLFALGMDNYITAMMTAAALLMMALQRAWAWYGAPDRACIGVIARDEGERSRRLAAGLTEAGRERRAAIRTALLLVPLGAGLLLSVIAPGNAVRMATDGAHQSGFSWLFLTTLWTLRDAALYFVRFFLKTPLLMVLLLLTPAFCAALSHGLLQKSWRVPPVWATLLGLYLILCAMIIPHMYSSGYAGSGRVVNMYHSYVVLASPHCAGAGAHAPVLAPPGGACHKALACGLHGAGSGRAGRLVRRRAAKPLCAAHLRSARRHAGCLHCPVSAGICAVRSSRAGG